MYRYRYRYRCSLLMASPKEGSVSSRSSPKVGRVVFETQQINGILDRALGHPHRRTQLAAVQHAAHPFCIPSYPGAHHQVRSFKDARAQLAIREVDGRFVPQLSI